MKLNRKTSSLLSLILTVVIVFTYSSVAFATIENNNSFDTACTYGNWQYATTDTTILPEYQTDAYYKFTVNSGEKLYVRCSYDNRYQGMSLSLYNSNKVLVDIANSPNDVINPTSVIPFLAVDCDGTSSSQTFYVRVSRGTYDPTQKMYFSISFNNRIRTGSGTFSFSGSATNPGNSGLSSSGVNSNILSLNLTNNSNIPRSAIVKSVTTSATQSPNQGNVHHMLMPAQAGVWYTAKVSSATSGSYNISESDGFAAAQVWQFKYNALASKSSTMSNIKLQFNWTYDLRDNNYEIFIN